MRAATGHVSGLRRSIALADDPELLERQVQRLTHHFGTAHHQRIGATARDMSLRREYGVGPAAVAVDDGDVGPLQALQMLTCPQRC